MRILALDLGTHTGFAWGNEAEKLIVGTLDLATSAEVKMWGQSRLTRRLDPRPVRLYRYLGDLFHADPFKAPDLIIFEDVEFSSYTQQCQLWASLRTAVWLSSHFNGTQHIDCVGVSKLKKFATGNGAAKKELMDTVLRIKYPDIIADDDNQVDAVWLWLWANQHIRL